MDFGQMILAHSKWKSRLKEVIQGQQTCDMQAAAKDNLCDLGKWIHSEGKANAGLAEYQDLVHKHAAFHACLPKVVSQSRGLGPAAAADLLDPINSEFGHASTACINAITALRDKLDNK